MTDTMDTAWLKEVCGDAVLRPSLAEPMTFVRDGMHFTIATDGFRIVELPGNYGEFKAAPTDSLPSLHRILAPTPATAVPFDYSGLKEFIQQEMKDVLRACLECDSTGQVIYFTSKGSGPHYAKCPRCEGACIRSKRVYIGGVLFNARLWEPMLANLPDVRIVEWYQQGPRESAIVDGAEWRFLVMPINDAEIDSEIKATYHRFEIPGAQAIAA